MPPWRGCEGKRHSMPNEVIEQFWKNARDSLKHAFDHYFELEMGAENKWHHHKWIIVSVHHAASCISYMWLKEARPEHSVFKKKEFPHLDVCVRTLRQLDQLPDSETRLIEVFSRLNDIRDKFM